MQVLKYKPICIFVLNLIRFEHGNEKTVTFYDIHVILYTYTKTRKYKSNLVLVSILKIKNWGTKSGRVLPYSLSFCVNYKSEMNII